MRVELEQALHAACNAEGVYAEVITDAHFTLQVAGRLHANTNPLYDAA